MIAAVIMTAIITREISNSAVLNPAAGLLFPSDADLAGPAEGSVTEERLSGEQFAIIRRVDWATAR
jgi:hypothetical protein